MDASCSDHDVPPSVVTTVPATDADCPPLPPVDDTAPTATQSDAVGHETEDRCWTPGGSAASCHTCPPSLVVRSMGATDPVLAPVDEDEEMATHTAMLPQETPSSTEVPTGTVPDCQDNPPFVV